MLGCSAPDGKPSAFQRRATLQWRQRRDAPDLGVEGRKILAASIEQALERGNERGVAGENAEGRIVGASKPGVVSGVSRPARGLHRRVVGLQAKEKRCLLLTLVGVARGTCVECREPVAVAVRELLEIGP